jgi:dihydroflavonol-4-reductase
MMANIGVTGAFGFLGANFVRALLEEGPLLGFPEGGPRILAFSSRTRSNPLFDPERSGGRVRVERLDLLDCAGLAGKFEGLDAVAHFAGLIDYRASMKRAVWDADVLGTKAVFDAALAAGVSRLLYVSSIAVLGSGRLSASRSPKGFCDEESLPYGDPEWPISFAAADEALAAVEATLAGDYGFLQRSRVAYIDAKIAGWELAKLYARERGLPVVTVFPGTVVGAGDLHRSMSMLVDSVWEGRLRLSLSGSTSFVTVRDFARGAALALSRGRLGESYILSGRDEHNLRYADYQDLIASLARSEGRPAKRKPPAVPRGIVLPLATLAELLVPDAGLTKAVAICGSLPNYPCTSAKARAELGYEPSASIEPAILECRRFSVARRSALAAAGATRLRGASSRLGA